VLPPSPLQQVWLAPARRAVARWRLIAIDELGYLNLKPEQVIAFFRLMDQRSSRTPHHPRIERSLPPAPRDLTAPAAKARVFGKPLRFGTVMRQCCLIVVRIRLRRSRISGGEFSVTSGG
jgi:hypothetical protein